MLDEISKKIDQQSTLTEISKMRDYASVSLHTKTRTYLNALNKIKKIHRELRNRQKMSCAGRFPD